MKSLVISLAVFSFLFGSNQFSHSQIASNVRVVNDDGSVSNVPMAVTISANEEEDVQTHLFRDPNVIRDLELVDDQVKALNGLMKSHYEFMQTKYEKLREAQSNPDQYKKSQAELADLQKRHHESLFNVLLPHQRERFMQVSRQIRISVMGSATALQQGAVGAELNVTEAQKKKFAEIGKELRSEIALKINELREEAKKKMLKELTTEQRKKFDEMIGEKFKRDENDWKSYSENRRAESKK